jgi:hypothetical protein
MSESIWDDPELKLAGNYVQFENPGDSVTGRIDSIRKQVLTDPTTKLPKSVVQIILTCQDGEQRTVTAGQVRLLTELMEQRPQEGDDLFIRFDKKEARGGGKTMKHFTVKVRRNAGHQPPAQPQAQGGFGGPPPGYAPQPTAQPPVQYQQPPAQQDPWGGQPAQAPGPQPPAQQDPWGGQPSAPQQDPWGGTPTQGTAGDPPF